MVLHPAHHALGGFHRDAPHAAFPQMLLYLKNYVDGAGHSEAVADDFERLVDRRQVAFVKLHVHRRTSDLNDVSYVFWHKTSAVTLPPRR